MRGATSVIVQTHQIVCLPRKMILQNFKEICPKQMKRHFQCAADPRMIRAWNRQSATRLATEVTFHAHHEHFVLKNTTFRAPAIIPNFTEYCACHAKWHCNFTKYCACHAKFNPLHTWIAISNARSSKCHCPNSPNIAPATKNNSHDQSSSHMKRYLQCAEQQVSLSKLTK